MIFKTFDNDIDKWTAKIGVFGKSFHTLGKTINKTFSTVIDDAFDGKNTSFWKTLKDNLYPKREDIQAQILDVDELFPKIDTSNIEDATKRISEMSISVAKGEETWQGLFKTLPKGEKHLAQIGQQLDGQIVTTDKVAKANDNLRQSVIDHNKIIEQSTLAFKAKTLAVKALSVAMNIGLSLAINAVITGVMSLVNAQENARKAAQEATDAFQEETDAIDDYIEKATELRKELDKGNLSYEDAHTTRSELMEIQDELIKKYGKEAEGIDLVTGSITDQTKAIHDLKKAEYEDTYDLDKGNIDSTIDQVNKQTLKLDFVQLTGLKTDEKFGNTINEIVEDEFSKFGEVKYNLFGSALRGSFEGNIYSLDNALKNSYDRIKEYYEDIDMSQTEKDFVENALTYLSNVRKNWSNDIIQSSNETFSTWIEYGEKYSDDYYQLIQQQEEIRKSIVDGSTEEIEKQKQKYASDYLKMYWKAFTLGDSGVIGWLERNGYSDFLNQFEEDADSVSNIVNKSTIPSISDLTTAYNALSEALDDIYSKQDKLTEVFEKIASGAKLSAREVLELVEDFPNIMEYITQDGDGYTIEPYGVTILSTQLENEVRTQAQDTLSWYEEQRKHLINELNRLQYGSVNNAQEAETRGDKIKSVKGSLAELEAQAKTAQSVIDNMGIDVYQAKIVGLSEKYNNLSDTTSTLVGKAKTLSDAFAEQNESGTLTTETVLSLIENGYAAALMYDKQTGKVKLNAQAYLDLAKAEVEVQIAELTLAKDNSVQEKLQAQRDITSNLAWSYLDASAAALELAKAQALITNADADITNYDAQIKALREYQNSLDSVITGDYGGTTSSTDDTTITAFEKQLKYLDYLKSMGMISAKEYYKQLYFLNEKYYSDNADYLEQYRDNEIKIRDGITDIEIRAIDRQIEALETLREKREEEKELQELQVELEEKKLELLNKQSQNNVRYYDANKREWLWTYNREDVADAQKAVDEAQDALDEHLYQSNEDKKIEQLEQIKEILQGDEDNPSNPVQFVGSEGVTTQATGRKVTFEDFLKYLGVMHPVDTTEFMRSIYSTGVQPNVETIAQSTHNQNISTINNRNVQGNSFNVTVNGSGLTQEQTEKAIYNALNELVDKVSMKLK